MKNRDRIIENKGTFASLTEIINQFHINMDRQSLVEMKTLLKHDEDVKVHSLSQSVLYVKQHNHFDQQNPVNSKRLRMPISSIIALLIIWLQMYLYALHTTLHPRLLAIFRQKECAKVQMHPSLNG